MVIIDFNYQGGFRCAATHLQSGNTPTTDAPVDYNGRGEVFLPTDLVANRPASSATFTRPVSRISLHDRRTRRASTRVIAKD